VESPPRLCLGETRFAEATLEGTQTDWSQLAAVTLTS
jgi:hypothetical protein